MSLKKELTMKAAAEIFKLASRIGIKPRDIIGQGADVIKMGKSLFNTKVNPKLTEFISRKGEVPTKILEEIKVHIRSLKSVSESQLELFKINLKDIVNAKFPKPVAGGKKLATEAERDIKMIDDTIQSLNKTEAAADAFSASFGTRKYYLNELKNTYPNHYRTLTGKETKDQLKEMIYRLDTEGVPFNEGGIAALNAELNQLPEYYLPMAEGGRIPYGVGDWVKKKIKPYTKKGRDEHKKEWLEKKNINMTVKEWNALSVKEKAKIWLREGNADGGIANHFRTR